MLLRGGGVAASRLIGLGAASGYTGAAAAIACFDVLGGAYRAVTSFVQPAAPASAQWQQQRWQRGQAGSRSGSDGSSGGSSSSTESSCRPRAKATPQLLQAWLQQEYGVSIDEAGRYAQRFARAYGGNEGAALAGLPRAFEEFRRRGLSGAEAAWALGAMAFKRRASVASIDGTLQVWRLLDRYISAYVRQQQREDKAPRRHSSTADMLRGKVVQAAWAVSADQAKVEALLVALRQRLAKAGSAAAEADVGSILLRMPGIVWNPQATLLAAMGWAAGELRAPDVVAIFLSTPQLLTYTVPNMRQKLVQLQATGLTAEQARQLAAARPQLLTRKLATMGQTGAWLRRLFPGADHLSLSDRLWDLLKECPLLLATPAKRLQRTADVLQRRLGWDDATLADEIERRSWAFVDAQFDHPDTEVKVLFLSALGVDPLDCFGRYMTYMPLRLETMVSQYVLVRKLAPQLLHGAQGQPSLSWIPAKKRVLKFCGLTTQEYNAHHRDWPQSEEGQRVLADLRAGSTKSLPPMPAPPARSS